MRSYIYYVKKSAYLLMSKKRQEHTTRVLMHLNYWKAYKYKISVKWHKSKYRQIFSEQLILINLESGKLFLTFFLPERPLLFII
jgi:hypothetical protein